MAVAPSQRLAAMKITREQLLMKLGAARAKAPVGWRIIDIKLDQASAGFTFALNRSKLRKRRPLSAAHQSHRN
jgi:hypothetical protein